MKNKIIFFTILTIFLPQITITNIGFSTRASAVFLMWESFKPLRFLEFNTKQKWVCVVMFFTILGYLIYYPKTTNQNKTKNKIKNDKNNKNWDETETIVKSPLVLTEAELKNIFDRWAESYDKTKNTYEQHTTHQLREKIMKKRLHIL